MNTGIQDAYNLAWKLAFVIKGAAAESLLDTYNEERLANAKRLLDTTDRMFELAAGSSWLMSFLRTTIFPPVAGFMASLETVSKRVFPLISQIGINYRDESLSEHTDDEFERVKAGDRLPYFQVDGQSIFDKLKAPKFHAVLFSKGESGEFQNLGDLVDCHHIQIDERISEIFGTEDDFGVLLRPDNHVAFIASVMTAEKVADYFRRFLNRD
jgi:hypothetical protein